jgi:hypothetical protein
MERTLECKTLYYFCVLVLYSIESYCTTISLTSLPA